MRGTTTFIVRITGVEGLKADDLVEIIYNSQLMPATVDVTEVEEAE